MKVGLVIFSRFDSIRLPGKALQSIGDRPLLGHVISRAHRVGTEYEIVVATSDRPIDDSIADFAKGQGVAVFRGAADDCLARASACAETHGFDAIARICGDRAFFDPGLVKRLIGELLARKVDLATNLVERTFPVGASVEIVTLDAMRRMLAETDDPFEREHMTTYIYRNPERFEIWNLTAPEPRHPEVRLVVDDRHDLDRACWIAERLGDDVITADLKKVTALALRWPDDSISAEDERP